MPTMRCKHCRYRLDGLADNRCPECGEAFDPNDPATFHVQRLLPTFGEWCCISAALLFLTVTCCGGLLHLPEPITAATVGFIIVFAPLSVALLRAMAEHGDIIHSDDD